MWHSPARCARPSSRSKASTFRRALHGVTSQVQDAFRFDTPSRRRLTRAASRQADVCGEAVTWLVPHALSQVLPSDVDYRVMLTFLEFYEARALPGLHEHCPTASPNRTALPPTCVNHRRFWGLSTSNCTTRLV